MDSLTQITLGAAVGEAVLGRKVGNKAIIWGGIAGLIPDLDILFFPFATEVQQLSLHRGFSHSLLFPFIAAPILGYLLHSYYKKEMASFWGWTQLFFWSIITHPLLDSLTTYGTQLFLPFSDFRVSESSVFIVDPVYTVPFLISVIICWRLAKENKLRRTINYLGLGVSTLYLCWTQVNKYTVNKVFTHAIEQKNIPYEKYFTAPTPLNNFLWYGIFKTQEGYQLAYYSLFDKDEEVEFKFLPSNKELIAPIEDAYAIDRLKWFSRDFYNVINKDGKLYFNNLLFGTMNPFSEGEEPAYVFKFEIVKEDNGEIGFREVREIPENTSDWFGILWRRIKGEK